MEINAGNLKQFQGTFYPLRTVLDKNASIQVYSCNTGKGVNGQRFVSSLAQLAGTEVYASNNITGIDGDWVLEVSSQNSSATKEVVVANYSKNLQTVNDDRYAIRTFATTNAEVTEIAIDESNGDIYFTTNITGDGDLAPMYRYDLAGNKDTIAIDWTGTNWHPFISTDIELWKDSIYSNLVEQLVTFNTVTQLNTYPLNLSSSYETGSAIAGDTLWTTSGNIYDSCYKIDLTTNTIIGRYLIGASSNIEGLEYCEKTNKLYIMGDSYGIRELKMDGSGVDTVIGGSTGSNANFAIDPDGQYAYYILNTIVYQVNLHTGTEIEFVSGLSTNSRNDLEFGPSAALPGTYSLYIGCTNSIQEVYTTLSTDAVTIPFSCGAQSIDVNYIAGTYNTGNIFTAQLSDSTGSFDNAIEIGNVSATTSGTIPTTIPIMPYGTRYRIRVVSSEPITNGADNGTDLVLGENVAPVLAVQNISKVLDATGIVSLSAIEVVTSATDNCTISDTVLSQTSFTCADIGIVSIDVTLTDASGNFVTETVDVTIVDQTAPFPDAANLADLTGECSVDIAPTAPTATDSCEGIITGVADVSFPVTAQGTTVITWSFEDSNGNISTQTQNVIITDVTAPIADAASLADLTDVCSVDAPTAPTATDNCAGSITGVADVTFPFTAQGTTVITWTFDDGNGNISTQTQNVIIEGFDVSVTENGSTLTADGTGEYQWLNCDTETIIEGETSQSFTASEAGSYAVIVGNGTCSDTSACYTVASSSIGSNAISSKSTVYPNPASGVITIVPATDELNNIAIYNTVGKLVYVQENSASENVVLNIEDFAKGMYIIQLSYSNTTEILRFIKE